MASSPIQASFEYRRRALFDATLALPERERAAFLNRQTDGDDRLREAVERLLAAAGVAGLGALDRPVHNRPPAATVLPRSIGPYQVVRQLGAGGMGVVYACRQPSGGGLVAVKVMLAEMRPRLFQERFERERAILTRLNHSNVSRILDAGTTPDRRPFIVMELVEGEPIDAFCSGRGLRVRDRLRLFAQVLAGVEYFHREQVIHRDLKPSNILVTTAGKVKILDFGISKFVSHVPGLTGEGQTGGRVPLMTSRYASPEQLERRLSGRRSDIYSLGILLYELLTRQHPYIGADCRGTEQILAAAARTKPPVSQMAPADLLPCPAAVDALVLKALSFNPGHRHGSAGEFLAALRVCLDDSTLRGPA